MIRGRSCSVFGNQFAVGIRLKRCAFSAGPVLIGIAFERNLVEEGDTQPCEQNCGGGTDKARNVHSERIISKTFCVKTRRLCQLRGFLPIKIGNTDI